MVNDFVISANAIERIKLLKEKAEDKNSCLRISVDAGGCSGFQYKYDFSSFVINQDDLVIEQDGISVIIDNISFNFLKGAHLDYIETLGESYFEVKNPNAVSGCGCGNSFAV